MRGKAIQRRGFGPLLPGVIHVPYPNGSRGLEVIEHIETNLFGKTVSPDEVAAIIVEPIQGEGGDIVPPPEFHKRLKALAEQHGILYIADEVQSGMGRTRKMFAIQHWGVEPDIVCLAKGIASGMPLGAMVAKSEIMDWPPGSHASTFGGNPVSCVAALETLALLEEGLNDHAVQIGDFLMTRLRELQERHELIGEVRGKGLMIGVELVRDQTTMEPAIAERDAVIQDCFYKGLLLLGCGVSSIRLSPPLVIDHGQAETAVSILDEVLAELEDRCFSNTDGPGQIHYC